MRGAGELDAATPRLLNRVAPQPRDLEALTPGQAAEFAARHIEALRTIGGGAVRVVDKHPQNVFALGLIAIMFPRAKIICCHRDARDNALSCFFQRFAPEMAFATDLADCGRRHVETERMADHWRRVLPVPIFDLHYEELVKDLEGQARRLIDFIGLDWDPACLNFYETERAVNTPSTWQSGSRSMPRRSGAGATTNGTSARCSPCCRPRRPTAIPRREPIFAHKPASDSRGRAEKRQRIPPSSRPDLALMTGYRRGRDEKASGLRENPSAASDTSVIGPGPRDRGRKSAQCACAFPPSPVIASRKRRPMTLSDADSWAKIRRGEGVGTARLRRAPGKRTVAVRFFGGWQ